MTNDTVPFLQVFSFEARFPPVKIMSSKHVFNARESVAGREKHRPSTARSPGADHGRRTITLPDKLTPEHLADMLAAIRASVR